MSEFALEDMEDDDTEESRMRVAEYREVVNYLLSGILPQHDVMGPVGLAAKIMDNYTLDCGVIYFEGKETTLYYHLWQINKVDEGWVFENIKPGSDGKIFSDPSLMQGLKTIDVMMKNEGVA